MVPVVIFRRYGCDEKASGHTFEPGMTNSKVYEGSGMIHRLLVHVHFEAEPNHEFRSRTSHETYYCRSAFLQLCQSPLEFCYALLELSQR